MPTQAGHLCFISGHAPVLPFRLPATSQMDSLSLPTYPFMKEGPNNLRAVESKGWRLFGTFPYQKRGVTTFHVCNGGIAPLLKC